MIKKVCKVVCHLNQGNVSHLFKRREQIISQNADPQLNTPLNKPREERIRTGASCAELTMLYPGIEQVITDVTEILCNKSKNTHDRTRTFSEKRSDGSLKKHVSVASNSRILTTSRSYAGRVHNRGCPTSHIFLQIMIAKAKQSN